MKLEIEDRPKPCEIEVGTFHFTENGESVEAEFYVKTCSDDQNQQVDDYNEQFTEEFEALEIAGKKPTYTEIVPSPIF